MTYYNIYKVNISIIERKGTEKTEEMKGGGKK